MYRPPNWNNKNPCIECPNKVEDEYGLVCDLACGLFTKYAYKEAGADAMLEGLKAQGSVMTSEQMKLLAPDRQYPYGHLVFIPDEVEE